MGTADFDFKESYDGYDAGYHPTNAHGSAAYGSHYYGDAVDSGVPYTAAANLAALASSSASGGMSANAFIVHAL